MVPLEVYFAELEENQDYPGLTEMYVVLPRNHNVVAFDMVEYYISTASLVPFCNLIVLFLQVFLMKPVY